MILRATLVTVLLALSVVSSASALDTRIDQVVAELESLSAMREELAATLDDRSAPITEESFKTVCAPVGKRLRTWAEKQGYRARQVSAKYRNPVHAPSEKEDQVLRLFLEDRTMTKKIQTARVNGGSGTQVYVAIPVVSQCLHCHGAKSGRPQFIKDKYKDDLAFDFRPGDLRGMYSVYVPD